MDNPKFQCLVRDRCGCCMGEGEFISKVPGENEGELVDYSTKCDDCDGTGFVDERWLDLEAAMALLNGSGRTVPVTKRVP